MAQRVAARNPEDEINRAFDLFDIHGNGTITLEDLSRVALELNETIDAAELESMIDEFDMDGDGAISRQEFIEICLG
jgi:Ca2+-binding EF-hand superfamily protein